MIGTCESSPVTRCGMAVSVPARALVTLCLWPAVLAIGLLLQYVSPVRASAAPYQLIDAGATGAILPVHRSAGNAGKPLTPRTICGLPSEVLMPFGRPGQLGRAIVIGRIFGRPVFVEYRATARPAGSRSPTHAGESGLAKPALAALYRVYVEHYAPLRLFRVKGSFKRLDLYCQYSAAMGGGGSAAAALGAGAPFTADVFLPIIIHWYRLHPAEAGPGWIAPRSGSHAAPSRLPPSWTIRDRTVLGHSAKIIRELRSQYPSLRSAEEALWLYQTQPPEVAMLCRPGFSLMRQVEAARRILLVRGNFMNPQPQLPHVRDFSGATGTSPNIVHAMTAFCGNAREVIYGAILQNLKSGVISLAERGLRQRLVALTAGAVGNHTVAPESPIYGAEGQGGRHHSGLEWLPLVIFLSGALTAGAALAFFMAVRAMRHYPLAIEGLASMRDVRRAYLFSVLGAFGTIAGAAAVGFFVPLGGGRGGAAPVLGIEVLGFGLFLGGYTLRTTAGVKWSRLQTMFDRVDGIASEIAMLKASWGDPGPPEA